MEIREVSIKDKDIMNEIVEMEKDTFGKFGGVDLWILKPIVKFGKVFVAIEDEKVVGTAEFMIAFDRPEVFLYGFSVMKEYREKGIGTTLLLYCEEYFKQYDKETISLTVDPKNIKAINLYQRINYFIESLEKDEYDIGIDRFIMKKSLTS